ncbi:MAG: zinc carboxypeptidase [Chloroflexi bacterium]|nr:zinc carboxypeptidase [Chloroflexota bacterium]MDQ3407257.1 M14 family metallopeptidase [Chloroflexota bacterium]
MHRRSPSRSALPRIALGLVVALLATGLGVIPVAALGPTMGGLPRPDMEPVYPPEDAGYHSYEEMVAEIRQVASDHPDIVRLSSIGETYKGRTIHLLRISDEPDRDEGEPEVLFDALHHAREHLTPEMALSIIHLLTDGYGTDPRITAIVDSRVIWVVPMLNPDGLAYDLRGDPYRGWRKNRQPNAAGESIGTDLNRNYGYRWGGTGASADPASQVYRGAAPWSAPETRAMRDFILSRRIDGRQRIRTLITFHTAGELILYPYGYTYADRPSDMTALDERTLRTLAETMAASNGYVAQQSSDLYLTSGGKLDWTYGRERILGFTFELYPSGGSGIDRFYPPDELIVQETQRNHEAVLYLLEQSDCPYRVIGKEAGYCGPFFDDLEVGRGWLVDADGTDTATGGTWQRGVPEATNLSGPKQIGAAVSGRAAMATGRKTLGCASCNDVDGGVTTVRSPSIDLPASQPTWLRLRYTLAHTDSATPEDGFRVVIVSEGTRTVVFQDLATAVDRDGKWQRLKLDLAPWDGRRVQVQLEAFDMGAPSLVEAAVDDVRVTLP